MIVFYSIITDSALKSGVQPPSYLERKYKHYFAFRAFFLLKSAIICINLLCGKPQRPPYHIYVGKNFFMAITFLWKKGDSLTGSPFSDFLMAPIYTNITVSNSCYITCRRGVGR